MLFRKFEMRPFKTFPRNQNKTFFRPCSLKVKTAFAWTTNMKSNYSQRSYQISNKMECILNKKAYALKIFSLLELQCSKLRVHPAPYVHILAARCMDFETCAAVCTRCVRPFPNF